MREHGKKSARMAPSAQDVTRLPRVTPLVRATHNQFEVEYLPPYGDPEVSIPGEILTYVVVGGLLIELSDRLG